MALVSTLLRGQQQEAPHSSLPLDDVEPRCAVQPDVLEVGEEGLDLVEVRHQPHGGAPRWWCQPCSGGNACEEQARVDDGDPADTWL